MNTLPGVSVIICTRNRAADLRSTLEAMRHVVVPQDLTAELLVVDNGSTDVTSDVVSSFDLPQFSVRYLSEPKPGQVRARNTGIAGARGEIIVFTDDDVRPSPNWLRDLIAPIQNGEADAVAGEVRMAPHLKRDWMSPLIQAWLASNEGSPPGEPSMMLGANMAFSRRVLERVPAFDPELGPGALGFCDDALFSNQLKRAGFRMTSAWNASIEHHFHAARLERASLLKRAEHEGRSEGYLRYHWEHHDFAGPRLRIVRWWLALMLYRLCNKEKCREGMTTEEAILMQVLFCRKQYLIESKRPRNYEPFGLTKLRGVLS